LAALAVGFATLICLFGHLGAIGLLGPDEPRYAWIGRAMAETGDWVTPRLYGSPWFEKPILYYWAAALGFGLHLPSEWAARLPSAIAALAAALGIAWLGWKHYGFEECPWSPALLAPLFFSTSVGAIGFSRAATPDMLFSASITLAMACATNILRDAGALRGPTDPALAGRRRDFAAIFGFGAFLGLAVLAKGPAAIILAGGAIAIWALATKHWRAAFRMLHPFAIASFCVVALPWYALCARRNPDFLRVFLLEHNFQRYVSDVFQHRQPFWFFIPITLLALIPWTAFLIPAVREGLELWRAKSWRDSPAFFFSCWAIFPILFFSLSQSKLPSYILPGIPALALVMAIGASRLIERSSRSDGWIFVLAGLTWLGLAAAGLFWTMHRLPGGVANPARVPMVVCAVVAIIGGMLVALLGLSRQRAALWASLLLGCALVEFAGIAILPRLDPYYSARSVGAMLRSDLRPDRLFVHDLPRASQYGLAFYLGRQLPEWSPPDIDAALVLTTPKGFDELRTRGLVEGTLDESHQVIVMVPVRARPRGVRD
jgi:4-amino-4-deoxy-L-arabinose transferase-like glycosyltransferase